MTFNSDPSTFLDQEKEALWYLGGQRIINAETAFRYESASEKAVGASKRWQNIAIFQAPSTSFASGVTLAHVQRRSVLLRSGITPL